MEALRGFLDSNVIFSLCWNGPEGTLLGILLELQAHGRIALLASPLVMDETATNLAAKRPETMTHLERIAPGLVMVSDAQMPLDVDLPEKDRVILSSAVACGADFFITGNKVDFAGLCRKVVKGTRVVEPRAFLNRRR
jgi:predicted nucleic acid-binding protein